MPWRQIAAFVFFAVPAITTAEVYTWTDDQGVVHFTDQQPSGHRHQSIELGEPSVIPMSENIDRGRRVTTINRQINKALDAGSEESDRAEHRKAKRLARHEAKCEGYRKRLRRIQRRLRAGYSNVQGNRLRQQRREVTRKLNWECLRN